MKWWMVWRYLKGDRRGRLTLMLSILGMSFGVAALVLAMAIVSGYTTTLKRSIIDSFGHLVLVKKGPGFRADGEFEREIVSQIPELTSSTPFLLLEAILAKRGELGGIILEGVDFQTHGKVVNLKKHLIDGTFEPEALDPEAKIATAYVGKGIQKKYQLKIGDEFRVVLPVGGGLPGQSFRTKVTTFKLGGVLDLGRYDFDQRYVVTDLKTAQKFGDVGTRISGYRMRIQDGDKAEAVKARLEEKLGYPYMFRTWYDSNRNVFLAADYEKVVIFFIVLLMVVAASFNIASSLFVSVLKRFHDISILKAMGASRKFIYWLFATQGLLIGFAGAVLGITLGYAICEVFMIVQDYYPIFPADIYRIDHVDVEIRTADLVLILISSMVICFLASLVPAKRGAELLPVEGLRYE
jgi:lipoprotein-releasing system permease protein